MHKFKWLNLVLLSLVVLSCGKPLPELEGIDHQRWIDDRNACQNKRSEMTDAITKEKNKLLALDQMQIVDLLGKPDQNELSKRNQKFFYYFIQPSKDCSSANTTENPLRLIIRFNAMGLAKEVAIE
jgi:hypothetical protein